MTTAVGTAALPEGGRIDFARLRAERRRRLLEAMAAHDLDAVILGRPANVLYASGARQLWTAGARPFGPACVVVRETGRAHLLSTWDEGVPAEVAHEDLFGLSWNPVRVIGNVAAVPGLGQARRVGTDGFGIGTPRLVASVAPGAEVADAGPALAAARVVKGAEELSCIETALAVAEGALAAMAGAMRPGITERELVGVHAAALADRGVTAPGSEAVACATPRRGPVRLRRMAGDRLIGAGELVALSANALYCGYEGAVGRAVLAGAAIPTAAQARLVERARDATAAVVAACRPGASGADLLAAWHRTGEASSPEPLAWGLGLGMEAPLISAAGPAAPVGAGAVISEGMVLAVQGWVAEEGAGGALQLDVVHVTGSGPRVLSRA
ncbi:MAG TPA: M24 family metallopeptidase [Acidimicrobiales bacterium]|nr:M24 family metallopeptidase [Acidimicrobiales bacterium]